VYRAQGQNINVKQHFEVIIRKMLGEASSAVRRRQVACIAADFDRPA